MAERGAAPDRAAWVALAAAHGITSRVTATWFGDLVRAPRVLVPVQLDALVVRQEGGTWADCAMQAPPKDAAGPTSRRDLLPPPFTNLPGPRPRGAYLHWALPDALTAGAQSPPAPGDGQPGQAPTTFPAIPDRWLVLRLSPSTARGRQAARARRAVRGWVLEAGGAQPVVRDLDGWAEHGPGTDAASPLTALGHGDVAWAAYYDNVAGRLGFHDPLDSKEVPAGPIAYLVCGWFADPVLDPLGSSEVRSLTDFDARMAALRWQLAQGELEEAMSRHRRTLSVLSTLGLPTLESVSTGAGRFAAPGVEPAHVASAGRPAGGAYTTDGSWWPSQTLYHGSVVGIGWPGVGWPGNEGGLLSGEAGGPPDPAAIRVAVGATMTDALSTLVAAADAAPAQARLLEAFMLGSLGSLDQADGRALVDAGLHAGAFGSTDGGHTTEKIWRPPTPAPAPPLPPDPAPAGAGVFPPHPPAPGAVSKFARAPLGDVVAATAVESHARPAAALVRESSLIAGRLGAAMAGAHVPPAAEPLPGAWIDVRRSLPRLFHPADPVLLVEGGGRSFKHGHDGRFTQDGSLVCRLSGFCVTELSCSVRGLPERPAVRGEDVLERGVEHGGVPPECEDLLAETVLLDPGTAATAAAALGATEPAVARNFAVEQTAWWATRDPRVDQAPLLALSGIAGTLPSPVAVTPPVRPWSPVHLDWELEYLPSPGGVRDWRLGEIDYEPAGPAALPAPDARGLVLSGRAHLTAGGAQVIAQAIRSALEQAARAGGTGSLPAGVTERFHSALGQSVLRRVQAITVGQGVAAASRAAGGGGVPTVDRGPLADIASALEGMDVLTGALDGLHVRLRGGLPGDGATVPPDQGPPPVPFFALRAGFMRLRRLRLVDGFGQVVDLAGSSATVPADPARLLPSEPLAVEGRPEIQALPPRFTSPARLWVRFMDAGGSDAEAGTDVSPVCGYLMPNHLDGALEVFGADGANLGTVRPSPGAGVAWEEAPGTPSALGQTPARAVPNRFLAGLAQGLLDWGIADATATGGRETALSALLRVIDSTLWSVDPFGHTGDEHLSLLVGHPVAVLRARVRLEVREPVTPGEVATMALPLRLGALTHWQDGLLGYFAGDDYLSLRCADAAVAGFAREVGPNRGFLQQANLVPGYYQEFATDLGAGATEGRTPVAHPYVDSSGVLLVQPNQDVMLTLLVEPHTEVHATPGLVPRKGVGLRREWIAAALARMAPTFRFGPVLVDPKRIRMPVAADLQGAWSWDHRADASAWAEEPVVNATPDALLPPDPARGEEGWLRLVPPEPPPSGGR